MADSTDKPSPNNGERRGLLETLDELIFHMNSTKNTFSILIISSFILAPLALIMGAIIALHPRFLGHLLVRQPEIALTILAFIIISVILASIWLYIGYRERSFFSNWDKKFRKYTSLKNQIDKELGGEE